MMKKENNVTKFWIINFVCYVVKHCDSSSVNAVDLLNFVAKNNVKNVVPL